MKSRQIAARAIKTKKVRPSKAAQYLADAKHMGDEPDVRGRSLDGMELLAALNWYNYMCSRTDAREYVETYLKANGRTAELRELRRVPDAWINLQAGWYSRMITRGGLVSREVLERRIQEMLSRSGSRVEDEEEPAVKVVEVKPSVRERVIDKASDVIGELEEVIDQQGYAVDVYDFLTKRQVAPMLARRVREFFKPVCEEAQELIGRDPDPQLVEGYRRFSKAQLRQRAAFYQKLLDDCDRFSDVAKKQKAPRKKKPVSVEKVLKGLKFQRESKEYKVVSISPEKVVGAGELWTFNTKYRTLSFFQAQDRGGLSVKGTTLVGYDESLSKGYRIGRKTEEAVGIILKGGKRAVSKLLEGLKECTLQHRCNENTILLKVER